MNLKEKVQKDIKQSLKDKKILELETLRLFFSSMKNLEIEKRTKDLENKDLLDLLKKQIKIYQESSAQLVDAGRREEAEIEITKLEFLKEYLPKELSKERLSILISQVILEKKAKSLKDLGAIIHEVQKKVEGRVDNVLIVQMIKEQLQQI